MTAGVFTGARGAAAAAAAALIALNLPVLCLEALSY